MWSIAISAPAPLPTNRLSRHASSSSAGRRSEPLDAAVAQEVRACVLHSCFDAEGVAAVAGGVPVAQKFAGKCGEARRVFALSADTFKDSCDRRCPRYYVDGHSHTDAESPVP